MDCTLVMDGWNKWMCTLVMDGWNRWMCTLVMDGWNRWMCTIVMNGWNSCVLKFLSATRLSPGRVLRPTAVNFTL